MEKSMSAVGKTVRLNRLFKEDGRAVMVALDHAISWGVIPGVEDIQGIIDDLAPVPPDAFTILKGTALRCYENYAGKIPFTLKCTSFSPFHPAHDTLIATVEEAIKLGAEAISIGATTGGATQKELLTNLAEIVRVADAYGLPTITHIYPKGEMIAEGDRYLAEHVMYAARAAAEIGIDVIKTFYTGTPETYARVIEAASPARVVISGGPKTDSLEAFFKVTRDGIDTGARGVTYGRNIWQSENPKGILRALKALVHDNASVKECMEIVAIR